MVAEGPAHRVAAEAEPAAKTRLARTHAVEGLLAGDGRLLCGASAATAIIRNHLLHRAVTGAGLLAG
jgi:hypothetical protein